MLVALVAALHRQPLCAQPLIQLLSCPQLATNVTLTVVTRTSLLLLLLLCLSFKSQTGIEDPNPFFQWLMQRPYAQQVIWGPHFYAQVQGLADAQYS